MFQRSANDVSAASRSKAVGAYALTSLISSGTLTTLWRARNTSEHVKGNVPATEYAIKRLQLRHVNDPELRALLLESGRLGLRISSSRVVRTIAVHEEPEPFVVLEYLDGTILQALLAGGQSAGQVRFVAPILVDVLEGLHALHTAGPSGGWVHGAPSARHIMITPDGVGHLLDLAHAVGPQLAWSSRRDAFLAAGEMAPEQALVPAHIDPRCDLFIVGATLWQVLTGKPLFAPEEADATIGKMLRMSIPVPSEAGATAGRALDGVCMRALRRSRTERFTSAAEMATALRDQAQKAGLWAPRSEIAAWLRGVTESTPGTSLALTSTIVGLDLPESPEQELSTKPSFRPSRPRPQAVDGPARVSPVASRMPSGARALPAPSVVAVASTSGASTDQGPFGKTEDSSVFRRSYPEVEHVHLPARDTAIEQDAPWPVRQPSVATHVSPGLGPAAAAPTFEPAQPSPPLNRKAFAAGSAGAIILLLLIMAFEDEFGSSRRSAELGAVSYPAMPVLSAAPVPPATPVPVQELAPPVPTNSVQASPVPAQSSSLPIMGEAASASPVVAEPTVKPPEHETEAPGPAPSVEKRAAPSAAPRQQVRNAARGTSARASVASTETAPAKVRRRSLTGDDSETLPSNPY